ncbi:ABC transporter substrate-binding protein [Streptomyces sp. NPDC020917]|uniref:ABC transporter substrate-binding protein n=1 Tax=Streptomyces sp. NPDC020917 TaxID=3365102 RepID=UPI0037B04F5A
MARRRAWTRLAVACAAVIGSTVVSACGSGSGTSADRSGQIFTWAAGSQAQWDAFVKAAQPQVPHTKITYQGPSFSDYWTKVKTQYSGGGGPCLVTTQSARTQELQPLLTPLDDLLKSKNVDVSRYDASMIKGMTIDGKLYALPYDSEPFVVYYNKDLFAKYHLPAPGPNFTTAEFAADAKALTKDGNFGFAPSSGFDYFTSFAVGNGATWRDDAGNLKLDNNPQLAQVLQQYFDLGAASHATSEVVTGDKTTVEDRFSTGKIGMIVDGTWQYSSIAAYKNVHFGIAPAPSATGNGPTMTEGSGWGISKGCKDKSKALDVLLALTSAKTEQTVAAQLGIMPAQKSAQSAWATGKQPADVTMIQNVLRSTEPQRTTPNWNIVQTLFGQYSPLGFTGRQSAAQVLQHVSAAAQ